MNDQDHSQLRRVNKSQTQSLNRRRLVPVAPLYLLVMAFLLTVFTSQSAAASPVQQSESQSLPLLTHTFTPTVIPSDESGLWKDVPEGRITTLGADARQIVPTRYRTLALDEAALNALLAKTPMQMIGTGTSTQPSVTLTLPLPYGGFSRFRIEESPIMAPELAAKFPQIKTYRGQGIDDPTATVRVDQTQFGFHAMILSVDGTVFIDPYQRGDTTHYISYYKRDYVKLGAEKWKETLTDKDGKPISEINGEAHSTILRPDVASGSQLRTYRLAAAATSTYTLNFGGTITGALAGINTTMNRVNGIYERELSITMTLIANNNSIIFTNPATDPYSGTNILADNQMIIDTIIGTANYDIGHAFASGGPGTPGSTGSGDPRVVCVDGSKARGYSGSGNPVGDPFDVDFVAHEIGHQFGASHSFNGSCGNRAAGAAFEPGSGSTIMSYAGSCGDENLQSHSDPYFHTKSFDEIIAYATAGNGNTCPVITNTGNNPPTVNAGADYTIPARTPFVLTGSATDPDNDPLTYGWEQYDLGTQGPPNTDDGTRPIFRSFNPTTSLSRIFPQLSDILNDRATLGESLPTTSRTLTFRLTARDNRMGGGGVNYDTTQLTVVGTAGPFSVTAPSGVLIWAVGTPQTITWDVANTNVTPINCSAVNIALSIDGGNTFPIVLAANTPNDGMESLAIPDNPTATARVLVRCANNIFFDISNSNFTIARPANLRVDLREIDRSAAVGDVLTHTLDVANLGPFDATRVTVTYILPTGLTYLSGSETCSEVETRRVVCELSALSVGSTQQLHITSLVSAQASSGASSQGEVSVSTSLANPLEIDLDSTNNNDSQKITFTNYRVMDGLQALYAFGEGYGIALHDASGINPTLNLSVTNPSGANWVQGGINIYASNLLSADVVASKIINAARATNELTVEAWISPQNLTQTGPAHIVSLVGDGSGANFMLGQGRPSLPNADLIEARLRTTATDDGGNPGLLTPNGTLSTTLTHVIFTRDVSGKTRIYVNGQKRTERLISGAFSNWDQSFRLALGNDLAGNSPWLGEYHLVAIYSRALTDTDVQRNFFAGPSGDKSVTTLFLPTTLK